MPSHKNHKLTVIIRIRFIKLNSVRIRNFYFHGPQQSEDKRKTIFTINLLASISRINSEFF